MAKQDLFPAAVAELVKALETFQRSSTSTNQDEWLRSLYSSYSSRMRSDNQRIWSTGAILIPLSVAGFAAFVALDSPQVWQAIVLGSASSALAWCWLFIAENHRAFQQCSEAWLVAIETTIGINGLSSPKVKDNWANRLLTFGAAIQWMRWMLVLGVTFGWLAIVLLLNAGRLTT